MQAACLDSLGRFTCVKTKIARLWRGRTAATEDADAYVELLTTKVLPELRGIKGHRAAYLLRREIEDGTEFVVMTLFDSIDAVRAFAGGRLRGRKRLAGGEETPLQLRPDRSALRNGRGTGIEDWPLPRYFTV